MDIITRKEAIGKGLPRYFTGIPCKYGHISEKKTCNGGCVECDKEWREKNPEYKKEWHKENKEVQNSKSREWKEKNPEYDKGWYEENKASKKQKNKEWREENPEYDKAYGKIWIEQNRDQKNLSSANRIAAKLHRTPS